MNNLIHIAAFNNTMDLLSIERIAMPIFSPRKDFRSLFRA
ncbi:hypothetical protein Echvi_3844 [Echinicola vietnamensis DSM 17526]|uniref:Uncharacterized protein n=1 Tax=Echinicola vietnamensis (strain DSM 17526 / LMG 23754 / KMM 6221) TaxID=926556 RepID=L0G4Y5_ECHVK|nr:hypothetical protein Echvi_3844 [Echinicola vietnamensis DSM 17526]